MSDNPYESPQSPQEKPLTRRSSGLLAALTTLTVPAAAILGGTTCGATYFGVGVTILTKIIIGVLAGFAVLMLCLLLGARPTGEQRLNHRRAMMRLILIGIPIGLAASTGIILLSLLVAPWIDERAFVLGPFLGGIGGFFALSIAFWTGLRKENATAN